MNVTIKKPKPITHAQREWKKFFGKFSSILGLKIGHDETGFSKIRHGAIGWWLLKKDDRPETVDNGTSPDISGIPNINQGGMANIIIYKHDKDLPAWQSHLTAVEHFEFANKAATDMQQLGWTIFFVEFDHKIYKDWLDNYNETDSQETRSKWAALQ